MKPLPRAPAPIHCRSSPGFHRLCSMPTWCLPSPWVLSSRCSGHQPHGHPLPFAVLQCCGAECAPATCSSAVPLARLAHGCSGVRWALVASLGPSDLGHKAFGAFVGRIPGPCPLPHTGSPVCVSRQAVWPGPLPLDSRGQGNLPLVTHLNPWPPCRCRWSDSPAWDACGAQAGRCPGSPQLASRHKRAEGALAPAPPCPCRPVLPDRCPPIIAFRLSL